MRPPATRLGDQDQLELGPLGAQLGEGLEQRRDPLQRCVGAGHRQDPARHARRGRRHEPVVDAEQHHPHARRVDPELADDVACARTPTAPAPSASPARRGPASGRSRTSGAGRAACARLVAEARSIRRSMLIGWWTEATSGRPVAASTPSSGEPRVWLSWTTSNSSARSRSSRSDAAAEGARLGEAGRPHRRDLLDVDEVAELGGAGRAERVGLAVEVQARHLGQPDALVELGVGLPGEHLDLVTRGATSSRLRWRT